MKKAYRVSGEKAKKTQISKRKEKNKKEKIPKQKL